MIDKEKFMFYGNRLDTGERVLGFLEINDNMSTIEKFWHCYITVYHYDSGRGITSVEKIEVDVNSIVSYCDETINRFTEPAHRLQAGDKVVCEVGERKYETRVWENSYQGINTLVIDQDTPFCVELQ